MAAASSAQGFRSGGFEHLRSDFEHPGALEHPSAQGFRSSGFELFRAPRRSVAVGSSTQGFRGSDPQRLHSVLERPEAPWGPGRRKRTPAQCFRSAKDPLCFRSTKGHWQAKSVKRHRQAKMSACAVFAKRQGPPAGESTRLRNVFEAPNGPGRRKRTPARCFQSEKWPWQAKAHACAVFLKRQVALAGENARLRSVFEASNGPGRRKRTPAQCFRSAKRHWQAKAPAQWL